MADEGGTGIDEVDRQILELLRADGRRTVRDVAHHVRLSPSPVRRRIERLERSGVISGYTAIIDERRVRDSMEAFAELRFMGSTSVESITRTAKGIPEVIAVYTVAGDPDALVHFRIANLSDLHRIIDQIRGDGQVTGTKTLMVLDSWRPGDSEQSIASNTTSAGPPSASGVTSAPWRPARGRH